MLDQKIMKAIQSMTDNDIDSAVKMIMTMFNEIDDGKVLQEKVKNIVTSAVYTTLYRKNYYKI